jgi:hypothetical protein
MGNVECQSVTLGTSPRRSITMYIGIGTLLLIIILIILFT